jgi:hypothetical protein
MEHERAEACGWSLRVQVCLGPCAAASHHWRIMVVTLFSLIAKNARSYVQG